jgi:uncharacterized membrane protein
VLKLFGLPAHPLLVHLPIVLTPLLGVAVVVFAVRRPWRARFGWILAAVGAVLVIAVQFAVTSGQELLKNAPQFQGAPIEEHQNRGETSRIYVIVLLVLLVAMAWFDRWTARAERQQLAWVAPVSWVLAIASAVVAILTVYWMIKTGHQGAKVTWEGVID